MNLAAIPSWSPQRWMWTIGVFFALQVFLAWYWLDRRPLLSRPAIVLPSLNLSSPQPVDPVWQPFLQLADPSLFARASRHGFSGAAWLNVAPNSQPGWTWTETNQWLGLKAQDLPDARQHWIHPKPSGSFVAEKPAPYYLEVSVPAEIVETNSFAQVEGDLQSRPWLAAEPLPSWAHTNLIKETILQVVVSAVGGLVSARLDASSGWEAADQFALSWAKKARFQPLPQPTREAFPVVEPFTWGRVIFHWGATNLPATNQPPGK